MVTLSVPERNVLAANSLPELLAYLFELHRARAVLDLLEEAITEELAKRVASGEVSDARGAQIEYEFR